MKRPRRPALDFGVYLVVRWTVAVLQMLSIEQSYALARGLAWALYHIDKRHRNVGLENLRLAFGDQYSAADRDRIIRGTYRHFCMMLMEILHIPRKAHLTTWRDRVRLTGHAPVLDRMMKGGPLIFLSGHFGNWEIGGYLFGLFGFPPHSVARALDNPYLDQFLKKFREGTGQKLISKNDGYDEMLAVLRNGGVLSFLADQDAGQRGLYVDFFGRPASTHKAIAILAIEHNAPVVVGCARRVGAGYQYEVVCEDVIFPEDWAGNPDDVRMLTQRFTTALEVMIRRDPEQYLWLHRRWKHQPKPRARPSTRPGATAAATTAVAPPSQVLS